MIAMIAVVAGGAAAADHYDDPDSYDVGPTYDETETDELDTVWRGQEVTIQDPALEGYVGFEIREGGEPDNSDAATVVGGAIDGDTVSFESEDLDTQFYHINLVGGPGGAESGWDGVVFEIDEEDFSASFEPNGTDKTVLEIESDRDVQTVNVTETAGLLDADDVDQLLPDLERLDSMHDDGAVFTAEVDLEGTNPVQLDARTDAVAAADYELDFDVTDSAAESNSTVVGEAETIPSVEYTLELEAGVTQTVGFPGPVNGTYGEVFQDVDGSLAAYDADTGAWETPDRDQEIDPLDAVVITPDEDVTISVPLEGGDDESQTAPSERELANGWNFVAPPQHGGVEAAYSVGSADVTRVLDVYERPGAQPFADGDDFGVYTIGGPTEPRVSAFAGYWTYVENDGTIAVNLYEGVPADEIPELLDP